MTFAVFSCIGFTNPDQASVGALKDDWGSDLAVAPTVYASLCDTARGRYWLFVEDVGRLRLEWCDVDDWPAALRWVGRMHAEYYGREGG